MSPSNFQAEHIYPKNHGNPLLSRALSIEEKWYNISRTISAGRICDSGETTTIEFACTIKNQWVGLYDVTSGKVPGVHG